MSFSTGVFLILFLPITMMVYFNPFARGRNFKNMWLLTVSLFFYTWGEPDFVFIMLISILLNWLITLGMVSLTRQGLKKILLLLSVSINIGILFYYKYLNFIVDNLNTFLGKTIQVREIVLPIGISFFTFQILSYVLDVYFGRVEVAKNLFHVALYVAMFPQLVAGPIVRYSTVSSEILERQTTKMDFVIGMRRFIIGLGKKVLLADMLAVLADELFLASGVKDGLSMMAAWLGAVTYTLQIFFDFSGYSDMAIGLGRCFGFHFEENFYYPYTAKSISEFWKRWHISLTNWFRDYVYIPLGGADAPRENTYLIYLSYGC